MNEVNPNVDEVEAKRNDLLEEIIHLNVCNLLSNLDFTFGSKSFKDDFAFQLDRMIREYIAQDRFVVPGIPILKKRIQSLKVLETHRARLLKVLLISNVEESSNA